MDANKVALAMSIINIVLFFLMLVLMVVGIKKKVLPVSADQVDNVLEKAETVTSTADGLASLTPFAPVMHIVDEAVKAAHMGVHYAEQLFKSDNSLDRKQIATEYAANTVKALGIEITPRVAEVMNGAVEAAVLALPPTQKKAESAPISEGDAQATVAQG